MASPKISCALISVSDKTGIAEMAKGLVECGVEILSTGGTAKHLREAGISVEDISEYTGFPEVMDGRVKTLHPKIFAGILARRDLADDLAVLDKLEIRPIELVIVNLYPFEETIAQSDFSEAEAIEQIDIGGPSLVRAAAKNSSYVTVSTEPRQYQSILNQVRTDGGTTPALRRELMAEAFRHTANYDSLIADHFAEEKTGLSPAESELFPAAITLPLRHKSELRYGENSHQQAALYALAQDDGPNLVSANQLHGKELSYNNFLDLESALGMVSLFSEPFCCVVKHNNPCGAAAGVNLKSACEKAFACDPLSAFGSVVGVNRQVDQAMADFLSEGSFFVEAILAPAFSAEALEVLTTKPKWKNNVRLVEMRNMEHSAGRLEFRQIHGGFLVQQADLPDDFDQWGTVTDVSVSEAVCGELVFAWQVVRQVKSNAIVLAKENATVGIGAGQMSRVDAVEIAIRKAGERVSDSVLASDAFFPFPDSIERAAEVGVQAIVQPGGSKRDDQVISACNEHGIAMVFTGIRHFRH